MSPSAKLARVHRTMGHAKRAHLTTETFASLEPGADSGMEWGRGHRCNQGSYRQIGLGRDRIGATGDCKRACRTDVAQPHEPVPQPP